MYYSSGIQFAITFEYLHFKLKICEYDTSKIKSATTRKKNEHVI